MNKADKERQERRRRMLAREQGHTSTKPIPGTSGDIGLRTPQPVQRSTAPPPATPEKTTNLKSLTPLLQQRQRRRRTVLGVIVLVIALLIAIFTGAMSASIALLADGVDSLTLYLNRGSGGWPVNTGISEPLQIEELAGGFVELGAEDVVVYSAYGNQVRNFQPGYARPVLAVGGTRFVVYNRAGNELQVSSRTRGLFTRTFDDGILLCAMSNNNTLAVVTESGPLYRPAADLRPLLQPHLQLADDPERGNAHRSGFCPRQPALCRRYAGGPGRTAQLQHLLYGYGGRERGPGLHYTYIYFAGLADR